MPQLSIETYITQYLWLVIILGFFYYYVASYIIPKISLIQKTRAKIASSQLLIEKKGQIDGAHNQVIKLGLINNDKKWESSTSKFNDIFDSMNKEWIKK